jgi:hypothetical protein
VLFYRCICAQPTTPTSIDCILRFMIVLTTAYSRRFHFMNEIEGRPVAANKAAKPIGLALLICAHIAVCCLSLIQVAEKIQGGMFSATFHVFFDPARLYVAVSAVTAFALVSSIFIFARFTFGYLIGFYLYTIIAGYLWLSSFTDLHYDHWFAGLSATASAIAFLLPALFISAPVRQIPTMTPRAFDRLLTCILVLGAATIAVGANRNFRFVSLVDMYEYRAKLETPTIENYLIAIVSSALLPFAFAGFVAVKAYWRAAAVLILLSLFYPITLTKITLFAPLWLLFILVLSRLFEVRIAVVLSLLMPVLFGLASIFLFKDSAITYFSLVNFRMIAVPSIAIDVYNDFFSKHDITHFCQIWFLKPLLRCSYQDPLSIVMANAYKLGNFNASLFATEGIASVGLLLAPIATLVCGLVIALGNRLSAGLPAEFVLTSGTILSLVLLNVPLSTALLTHGAGILFLLWCVTPRSLFDKPAVVGELLPTSFAAATAV